MILCVAILVLNATRAPRASARALKLSSQSSHPFRQRSLARSLAYLLTSASLSLALAKIESRISGRQGRAAWRSGQQRRRRRRRRRERDRWTWSRGEWTQRRRRRRRRRRRPRCCQKVEQDDGRPKDERNNKLVSGSLGCPLRF